MPCFPQVFHLYIYLVSLLFLVYLHTFLLRQRDDLKVVRNIRLVSNNQLDSPDKSAFAVQVGLVGFFGVFFFGKKLIHLNAYFLSAEALVFQ